MSFAGVPVGSKSTVVLAVVIYAGRDEPRGAAVVVSSIASAAVVVSSIASVLWSDPNEKLLLLLGDLVLFKLDGTCVLLECVVSVGQGNCGVSSKKKN